MIAGGVDERLLRVRALLGDGDRVLEDASREADTVEQVEMVSENRVDIETEGARERAVRQEAQPRL